MPIQAPQWTDFLSCPVCYNLFNEQCHRPISLGCGHTVCKTCLSKLHSKKCPFDQSVISRTIEELPVNYALLQLVGAAIPEKESLSISDLSEHCRSYESANGCIEQLAVYLKPFSAGAGTTNAILSRPMQRKLVALVNCQLIEEEGRARAMRAARSLSERTVTELILQHQNPQQLSANLWAAVRARGCQFLGPAMQEEVLKLILLALEDGSALSRKVLVLFVVQRLEPQYPQASKTAIGHVVQLLYRASCFKVTKRDEESSLMQLKEEFRTYETLRREHDAQIVQIATEAGLRISPDQWSSLLYGDTAHKSHMQSIIDKLQTPQSFGQSVNELVIALQRTGDPGNLSRLRPHFELLANIDPSPDAPIPTWDNLEAVMNAVKTVVEGLVDFIQHYSHKKHEPANLHNTKYKTNMCRDLTQKGSCPRGANCTFAHSRDEMERYRARNKKFGGKTGTSSVAGLTPKEKAELDQVTKSTRERERMIAKSARQESFNPLAVKHLPVTVKLATTSEPVNTESTTPCSLSPECSNSSSTTTTVTTSKATISSVSQEHAGSSNTTTTVSSVPFPKNSVPYSTNNSKEERFSPVPVSHSITVPNCTPIIQSYEIPSNHIDGTYYSPSQYCLPPRHQRLPVPANQYPFNYRVDPGISHVQYRASAMFDIHAMPVPPLYTDPWKKQGSHFDPKKENYIQKTVPTSGPFPDHSGWEQSVTSAKNVEDLPDRHLEILNLLPSRVPTTGAPCTPVTNAPAIYQHNYQTNIQDMGDVIKEPKSIISPCVAKSSAETYIATSTTSSLSNSVACGSSNVCTSTESSYVSWSSGDSPSMSMDSPYHTANQNATQLTNSTHQTETGNKDPATFFDMFIDSTKKDLYDDAREEFARQQHGEYIDDFIPFDPPIVSKFGPISRSKAKDKSTGPVQVTAEGSSAQVIPVTAATPYERPYVVSSSLAPSRYKSIVKTTSSTQSQLRPDAKPFVLSNPTGTEEQMTELEAEIESANPSEELYTLWNFQESLRDNSSTKIKEISQLAHKNEKNEGERLDLELRTIELQITLQTQPAPTGSVSSAEQNSNVKVAAAERLQQQTTSTPVVGTAKKEIDSKKMKNLHMALEAQRKETNILNKKKKQEQQDRQYAEKLVIEELAQKVKDTTGDNYINNSEQEALVAAGGPLDS